MNFLEQVAAEWFTLNGYFVRTNLKYGKRAKGGWEGEMDVVAFHPQTGEFIHIETSMDAGSWANRQKKFARKFQSAEAHLSELFSFPIREKRRIAVVGFGNIGRPDALGAGIEVKSLAQFIREVGKDLQKLHPLKQAIPETMPLLRAMQFAIHWHPSKNRPV